MKKALKITYLVLGLLLILAVGSSLVLSNANKPFDRDDTTLVRFVVEQGDTTEEIAASLQETGLIDSAGNYCLISKVWRYDGKYIAGKYSLSPGMTKSDIAKILTSGSSDLLSFSVPEGLTIYEVADLLSEAGYVDRDKFVSELENGDYSQFDFLEDAQDGPEHLEGYLFPKTYYLDVGASENDFITTMLNQFDIVFTDAYKERAEELGMTTNDIIILASLIERETDVDGEKALIASVFYNRARAGMPVYYGNEDHGSMPAGPVCSPGEASIRAALYPAGTDYLYYKESGKPDGSHEFSEEDERSPQEDI